MTSPKPAPGTRMLWAHFIIVLRKFKRQSGQVIRPAKGSR